MTQSLRSWACCAVFRDHGYTPTILDSLKDRLCPTYSMTHSAPLSLLKLTQEKESSQQNQVCLLPYMWSSYFIIWELCFRSTKQPKGLFSPFYIVCFLKIVSGLELFFSLGGFITHKKNYNALEDQQECPNLGKASIIYNKHTFWLWIRSLRKTVQHSELVGNKLENRERHINTSGWPQGKVIILQVL